jgi:hypothetical protein
MTDTVMTKVWGEQPVIDTWTDCRNVKDGWRGHLVVEFDQKCPETASDD